MTSVESDALRFASRCVKAITGYTIPEALREWPGNEEAVAALAVLEPVWANCDRERH